LQYKCIKINAIMIAPYSMIGLEWIIVKF